MVGPAFFFCTHCLLSAAEMGHSMYIQGMQCLSTVGQLSISHYRYANSRYVRVYQP